MIRAVCLDIAGVLYQGDAAVPGAADAVARLRAAGLPVRFLTNSSRSPKRAVLEKLARFGIAAAPDELFTPVAAARAWLDATGHRAHLLVHPALEEDFAGGGWQGPPAVVLGDAGAGFTYDRLNAAFRLLAEGAPFLALAANRVFRDADGLLSLDAGAFVRALEYASGTEAQVLGKPAPAFFAAAVASTGCPPGTVAMIGDDAENDVAGALRAGLGQGILVRTGKYRTGDETAVDPPPSHLADDLGAAVARILNDAG